MTDILFGLLSVLVSFLTSNVIIHYPLWTTLGWKKRWAFVYVGSLALFISVCYFIVFFAFKADIQGLQLFKLLVVIPTLTASFILYRKRMVWQFVFLAACAFMYGPIGSGIGLFMAATFTSGNTLLTESIVTLIIAALTLPPLLLSLKRLCGNAYMKQAIIFWRFIWLLPVFFFTVTILTNSYITDSTSGISFIIIRIIMYFALLLISYLLDKAIQQISEAEAAKQQADEQSAKTDFYRRMSHEIRTPLTKISTNIQVANMQEETDHERLKKSQEEIMKIASIINDALDVGGDK